MSIEIKYFASLRDQLGRAGDRLESVDGLTVAGVWATLWPDAPKRSRLVHRDARTLAPLDC